MCPNSPVLSGYAKVDFALSKQTLSHKFKLGLSSQLSHATIKDLFLWRGR